LLIFISTLDYPNTLCIIALTNLAAPSSAYLFANSTSSLIIISLGVHKTLNSA
jgi:hypothetical protein